MTVPTPAWKKTEKAFEDVWKAQGKSCAIYRFPDSSDINGLNKALSRGRTHAVAEEVPSDYHITHRGRSFFAEVKHCEDEKKFSYKGFQQAQLKWMTKITLAGGQYWAFVYAAKLDTWFMISAKMILDDIAAGVKSTKWNDMTGMEWKMERP